MTLERLLDNFESDHHITDVSTRVTTEFLFKNWQQMREVLTKDRAELLILNRKVNELSGNDAITLRIKQVWADMYGYFDKESDHRDPFLARRFEFRTLIANFLETLSDEELEDILPPLLSLEDLEIRAHLYPHESVEMPVTEFFAPFLFVFERCLQDMGAEALQAYLYTQCENITEFSDQLERLSDGSLDEIKSKWELLLDWIQDFNRELILQLQEELLKAIHEYDRPTVSCKLAFC